jgi:hypothetical protein
VPAPDVSTSLVAITLVTYGADGLVSAVASDLGVSAFLAPPVLILRADGVEFVLVGSHGTLSVPLERYLEVRSAVPAGATCTVLVGGDLTRVPVSIDGAGPRVLQSITAAIIPAEKGMSRTDCQNLGGNFGYSGSSGAEEVGPCMFTTPVARYPLTLPEGTHVIHFTYKPFGYRSAADVVSTLTCQADQVTFATLGPSGPATVTLSPQAPASDGERRVIIYDDGTWLCPATSVTP